VKDVVDPERRMNPGSLGLRSSPLPWAAATRQSGCSATPASAAGLVLPGNPPRAASRSAALRGGFQACAPYGSRTPAFVAERALAIAGWLVAAGAKALVVACNAADQRGGRPSCRAALQPAPIVAMEPAVKPAALLTRSGVVAVLATRRTVEGDELLAVARRPWRRSRRLAQACPGLVGQVEAGALDAPSTRQLLWPTTRCR
jgi:hypothetical protein